MAKCAICTALIGDPVENAAVRNHNKYYGPPVPYKFIPIGFETMGPINAEGRGVHL